MRRLPAESLSGFNEAEIERPTVFEVELADGRRLDYETLINHTPVVTTSYDGYADPQLVMGTEDGPPAWDEHAYYPVGRLDPVHGRTLEVLAKHITVKDEFDNTYNSLNIKGCDLTDPHLFKTLTAAREYIIHGLQESLVMERVIRASRVLRENGVNTEYICGLALPESFLVGSQDSGIDDKESIELPELLEHMSGELAKQLVANGDTRHPLEIKLEMIERFQDCDYLITYRAMDSPFRLGELHDPEKYDRFKAFLMREHEGKEVATFMRDLEVEEYISGLLAFWLGSNMARMHEAGLYHKHPVRFNLTAFGGIVDLDSCEGEPLGLGDNPIGGKEEVHDVATAISALQEEIDLLPADESDPYAPLNNVTAQHNAGVIFLRGYLKERFRRRGDRTEFLADYLQYENGETKKTSGNWLYRMVEQAHDAYKKHAQIFYPDNLELYKTARPPSIDPATSFLSPIPPELFAEMKELILDPEWTMNSSFDNELAQEKKPILNPIKLLVKNATFEHLIEQHRTTDMSAEELLFLTGAARDRWKPRLPQRRAAVEQARRFFQSQTELVIDRLSEPRSDSLGKELGPLLKGSLKKYEKRVGNVDVTSEDEPPVDILYLKDREEYEEVFEAIGIDQDTPITFLAPATVNAFIEGRKRLLFPDSILIADYEIARWNAEQETEDRMLGSLFRYREKCLPLLMIRGLSTGSPTILAYPTLYRPLKYPDVNHHDLLQAMFEPQSALPDDQLLLIDEELDIARS